MHIVGLLALSALIAQDKPEAATSADAKAEPAKDFTAIERRMDKILPLPRGKEDRTPPGAGARAA